MQRRTNLQMVIVVEVSSRITVAVDVGWMGGCKKVRRVCKAMRLCVCSSSIDYDVDKWMIDGYRNKSK